MRKSFLVILSACLLTIAHCQLIYWQQEVNYNIDVSLRDKDNTLAAFEKIEYTNNSPDSLKFIWFHLWPNAYKNENTAFAKQIFREKDGKKKWKDLKDKGWIDSLDFEVDGVKAKTEPDPENIDIVKLLLPSILAPGGKTFR
ncbi:MAG: M1 family metallopeptidase [Bacteroidetes bacterium]|nr:MAG: M1 family metallopeptidase [Bacteroidota bacterium]